MPPTSATERRFPAAGGNALFAAFACDAHHFAFEINVFEIELDEFADAHARRIQKFENRPVAFAQIGFQIRRFDKSDRVFD